MREATADDAFDRLPPRRPSTHRSNRSSRPEVTTLPRAATRATCASHSELTQAPPPRQKRRHGRSRKSSAARLPSDDTIELASIDTPPAALGGDRPKRSGWPWLVGARLCSAIGASGLAGWVVFDVASRRVAITAEEEAQRTSPPLSPPVPKRWPPPPPPLSPPPLLSPSPPPPAAQGLPMVHRRHGTAATRRF